MKILKYIFLLLALLSVAFLVFVVTQPSEFSISRTKQIKISKEVVFDFITDSTLSSYWSPWEHNQAVFSNIKSVHEDSLSQTLVLNHQENESFFKLKTSEKGTMVTWNLKGNLDFKLKLESILSGGVDRVLGKQLEKGLVNIENYLVKELNTFTVAVNGVVTKQATNYIQQIDTCKASDFQKKSKEMLQNMLSFVKKNEIRVTGLPFIDYKNRKNSNGTIVFAMCVPVEEQILTTEGSEISGASFEEFLAVKATLTGDYSHSEKAWKKALDFVKKSQVNVDETGHYIEVYRVSLPNERKPSKWITEFYLPVKQKVVNKPKPISQPKVVKPDTIATPSNSIAN